MHTANYFEDPEPTTSNVDHDKQAEVLGTQVKEENTTETSTAGVKELKYGMLILFKNHPEGMAAFSENCQTCMFETSTVMYMSRAPICLIHNLHTRKTFSIYGYNPNEAILPSSFLYLHTCTVATKKDLLTTQ